MNIKVVKVDRMFNDYVLEYSKKQIMNNAKLDKLPTMAKTTKILTEECIIDGNTIIFRIPNGSSLSLKKRVRSIR